MIEAGAERQRQHVNSRFFGWHRRGSKRRLQLAFTLVELVAVIVILGILSVFALPRLLNLGTAARVAVVQNFAGSLQAAVTMVHGACVATPGCINPAPQNQTLVIDGKTFALWFNYPNAGLPLGGTSVDMIVDASGFQVVTGGVGGNTSTTFQLPSATDPNTCAVTYNEANVRTLVPVIQTVTSGC